MDVAECLGMNYSSSSHKSISALVHSAILATHFRAYLFLDLGSLSGSLTCSKWSDTVGIYSTIARFRFQSCQTPSGTVSDNSKGSPRSLILGGTKGIEKGPGPPTEKPSSVSEKTIPTYRKRLGPVWAESGETFERMRKVHEWRTIAHE
jgi:hypothetical protein